MEELSQHIDVMRATYGNVSRTLALWHVTHDQALEHATPGQIVQGRVPGVGDRVHSVMKGAMWQACLKPLSMLPGYYGHG